MKTFFDEEIYKYDGTQMQPLRNYLKFGLMGDSCVSWIGPCSISFDKMLDGEDLRAQSSIAGDQMLHFVFELFDIHLSAAVAWQRLVADIVRSEIINCASIREEFSKNLKRDGDDIFLGNKKLSISIAAPSINSNLVHFAINIVNTGTPVETAALVEFNIEAKHFAKNLLNKFSKEWLSIKEACVKIKSV